MYIILHRLDRHWEVHIWQVLVITSLKNLLCIVRDMKSWQEQNVIHILLVLCEWEITHVSVMLFQVLYAEAQQLVSMH